MTEGRRTASMYERLGGMAFFESLTQRFYEGVATDALLRPLYPADLEPPRRHLCLFLAQFWGGPRLYDEERGHPRLRARHLPFKIGIKERDQWVHCMMRAMHELALDANLQQRLAESFMGTADWMRNTQG